MPPHPVDEATNQRIRELKAQGISHEHIHSVTGVSMGYISKLLATAPGVDDPPRCEIKFNEDKGTITTNSAYIRTVDDAVKYAQLDTTIYEVYKGKINPWRVAMGKKSTGTGKAKSYMNYQVTVFFRRKAPERLALETILERIERASPIIPKIKRPKTPKHDKRMLEVSLFDLHLGCRAFEPAANKAWSTERAKEMAILMQEQILAKAALDGPFEYILYPVGNDFQHSDNVFHTTTAGTGQPEADSWHHVFVEAEGLLIQLIDRLKEVAPVKVVGIPGNHDRQTAFAIGRVLQAYYHNDKNVEVDASSSPYKFHHYGVNLIGFEHGHSIKPPLRLASLMANENREAWAVTSYREWHLGDQHRKASAKPSSFEEQGVSVEYLPALTPANEWHRLKGFNWQKRACMAFVWDKKGGCSNRYQVNVDSYTGKVMG